MYGGIEALTDPGTWMVLAAWCWIGFGLLLTAVARSAMANRVRREPPDRNPFSEPALVPKYRLVRAYFWLYGIDSNSGAFLTGAAMIGSGLLVLVRLHQALGA
jgi:hypothetical protein